jgi:Catalase
MPNLDLRRKAVPTTSANSMAYPGPDEALGEKLFPDEAALTDQLANTIEKSVRARYTTGRARRDVHSKSTGFLKAEFHVNDELPDDLAKGVFIPGKIYQAWIRFSNGSGNPDQSDNTHDARGMAIKLLGVPGEKILECDRNATTQDFIMINHPVFLTNDPQTYLSLVRKTGSNNPLTKLTIPFTLGLKGASLAKKLGHGKISNPLQVRYFSAVPYQLGIGPGRRVIKFSVKPTSPTVDPIPDDPAHDYLRDAIRTTLEKHEVVMKFLVQPRTSNSMSVEDCMTEWDETQAPFYEVANIRIPKQNLAVPEQDELGENFSFNPWHALPEHRPLGSVNRMRKVVYERISRVRNDMNSVERREA